MGAHKGKPDLGSVMMCIVSPTRIVLVKDEAFVDARWKLPGGGIEPTDGGIVAAAIREAREETGMDLAPKEIMLCSNQRRAKDGTYYPYLCLAQVSEEKLDTHQKIADENGKPIRVADFRRAEVSMMVDLLERHRGFVKALEEVSVSLPK